MKEPSKPGQEKGSFPFQLPQWSNANELEGLTLGNKRTKLLKKLNNFRCKTEKKKRCWYLEEDKQVVIITQTVFPKPAFL